jgi:type I restriction enzyme S subunit
MQKLFSQQIRFKQDDGSSFPDWQTKPLGEIAIDGFSNGVFNDPDKAGKGYRLINVKDMYEGDSINVESLSQLLIDEKEFRNNQAKYGDIFFTRSSLVKEGIAYSNVLLATDQDITYDGHLIRFRFDIQKNQPQFMSFTLKSSMTRKQLVARGKTGTMTTIGQEDISTVEIGLPVKEEQEKIASFLSVINQRIETVSRQIDYIERFKKGLIQKMFV